MPGFKFTTDLRPDAVMKLAFRRAQDAGYSITKESDRALRVRKGNIALSVALFAYCDFRVSIEDYPDGHEVVLESSSPWWTGKIGVSRTRGHAHDLIQGLKEEVRQNGGTVTREKEF